MSVIVSTLLALPPMPACASSRIKDIVSFEGIRENHLIGYGLVVGLNGTGDNLNNNAFTQKGLIDFLERLGVNTRGASLKTKNVAAVTVTASLPPFARQGSRIDVTVSTLGDAKSLQDGTLLATPLVGADGQVYAVAQGQISIGGFKAVAQGGTQVSKNVSTNAAIVNGAIVEKETEFDLSSLSTIKMSLHNPDLTTAQDIESTININLEDGLAKAIDPGTVELNIPAARRNNIVQLLANVEQLMVSPDQPARIVIDEASGTIVMGANVRISPVAIAQGNLTISISENYNVSQPGAFSPEGSETVVTPQTQINVDEERGNRLALLEENTTLGELVSGLNALGVGPRDMITILQTIKAAGAVQASIETR